MERLRRQQFMAEFKLEAAKYVLDQGLSYGGNLRGRLYLCSVVARPPRSY
jgi:hypothetical protein